MGALINKLSPEHLKIIDKQWKYCVEHDAPFFMPADGWCWNCGQFILDKVNPDRLVTGCPFCSTSFCE